ncbi:MAG: hypothetical protein FWC09_05395 [Lachnospiraceae bacterium]|nr:hypothetical protein [Lachnospiraceae bacterium]
MTQINICIVGKDKRQDYLGFYLEERGFTISRQEELHPESLSGIDFLIGPIAFYPEGKLRPDIEKLCREYNVKVLNYMACEDYLLRNAELSAEGLLAIIISNTAFTLDEANILILGLGRTGKALEKVLEKISLSITGYDILPDSIPAAASYDIVINTIPAPILTGKYLKEFRHDCAFFDIASVPGGFDLKAVEEMGLSLINCPGIPGKYSPLSAGFAIGRSVTNLMNRKDIP